MLVGHPWHRPHCMVFSLAGVEKQRRGKGSTNYDGAHYSIVDCSGARSYGSVLLFPRFLIILKAELARYGSSVAVALNSTIEPIPSPHP